MQAVAQSISDGLGAILGALPALIGAIIILVIGFIIAKVLQGIVTRVLQSMGFQGWMESGGIKQFFDRSQTQQTPLSILGKLVFWLVFFIAITMAVETLGISAISDVLAQFIAYIPQIIAAILILVLATLLANFVAGIVRGRSARGRPLEVALASSEEEQRTMSQTATRAAGRGVWPVERFETPQQCAGYWVCDPRG
ncbi:MAG TPA: hypothetical protein VKA82_09660 [Rubrobacter sp.]|nr:hypothetical protein [Rubrobacter sp.]